MEMSGTNRDLENRNPTRYRITDADGKPYAPFRLKPGVTIRDVIAQHIPLSAQDDDWSVTEVRS